MENRGQKLRSVNMKDEVTISQMAPLYRVEIQIPNKKLKSYFDGYWEKNEHKIIEKLNIKGKKSKGGKQKNARKIAEDKIKPEILYMPTAVDILKDYLVDVLFIDQVEIADYNKDKLEENARVLGLVYFTPELHHDGDIDMAVEKDKLLVPEEEKEWEARKKELRLRYKIFREYTGELNPDLQVLLDVMSNCDGKPSAEFSYQDKWQNIKYLPEDLKKAILDHKIGDVFECTYKMKLGKQEAKEVSSTVKIHKAREIILPDLDNELAKKEGVSSLDELKVKFLESYHEHVDDQNKTIISDNIVNNLLLDSTFDPFPMPWISENVRATIEANKEQFQCDEKGLCQIFGAEDLNQLEDKFKGELYRKHLVKVALNYYAKEFDLDSENMEEIVEHMVENVELVEAGKEEK